MTWRQEAACAQPDVDPDLFVGPESESVDRRIEREAAAIMVCRRCPVQEQCLAFAVANAERVGVWGGLREVKVQKLIKAAGTRRTQVRTGAPDLRSGARKGDLRVDRCPAGHPYTEANTYAWPGDKAKRGCVKCRRARARAQQAAIAAAKTHCRRGHPYDEENTGVDTLGRRVCKTCRTEAGQRRSREIDADRVKRKGWVA